MATKKQVFNTSGRMYVPNRPKIRRKPRKQTRTLTQIFKQISQKFSYPGKWF